MHQGKVMHDRNNGPFLAMPDPDQADEICRRTLVNGSERLIEEYDRGILHKKARKQGTLHLTARKSADGTPLEPAQAYCCDGIRYLVPECG